MVSPGNGFPNQDSFTKYQVVAKVLRKCKMCDWMAFNFYRIDPDAIFNIVFASFF